MDIPRWLFKQADDHARSLCPKEACGILVGPHPWADPTRWVPIRNISPEPEHTFIFDPEQQLATWAEMEDNHEYPVVFVHSHPNSPPNPSKQDIRSALGYPDSVHLILSYLDRKHHLAAWHSYITRHGMHLPCVIRVV